MKKWMPLLLAFLCLFGLARAEGENLLLNPGFETVDEEGLPADWSVDAYDAREGISLYTLSDQAHAGDCAARIRNVAENDARFYQNVAVEPETMYKLSGYIRTENIADSGHGANLSIEGVYVFSDELFATRDWTYVELYGETGPDQTEVTVFARLGGYSGISSGTAYFDDLKLEQVDTLPDDVVASLWFKPDQTLPDAEPVEEEDTDEAPARLPQLLLVGAGYVMLALLLSLLRKEDRRDLRAGHASLLLGAGLLLSALMQLALAYRVDGYPVDVNCFLSWGNTMRTVGASRFYQSVSFCDYPPAYLLVMGLNSTISSWLTPITGGDGFWATLLRAEVIIKLIPIGANVLAAYLTDRFARKQGMTRVASASVALLMAFSPALMLNSGAWSQIDSVLGLLLLAVVLAAIRGQWSVALPMYMLSVLVKPQALMFGPLGLAAAIMQAIRSKDERKSMLIGLGGAAAVALALLALFTGSQPFGWLVAKYRETLASYPYATVNTANYYYLFKGNWSAIDLTPSWTVAGGLALLCAGWGLWLWLKNKSVARRWIEPAAAWAMAACFAVPAISAGWGGFAASWGTIGMLAMVAAFVLVLPMLLRTKSIRSLPFLGAVLLLLIYAFGTKMHERYLFPALMLLGAAYVLHRDRRILWLLVGCGVTVFLNEGIVLDNALRFGAAQGHLNQDTIGLNNALSVANVLLAMVGLWTANDLCVRGQVSFRLPIRVSAMEDAKADPGLHWRKRDTLLLLAVTAATALLSLTHLGSTKAPQHPWKSTTPEETITIDLGRQMDAFTMLYFSQISYHPFAVSTSVDGTHYAEESWAELAEGQIFRWKYVTDSFVDASGRRSFNANRSILSGRYVRIRADQVGLILNEVIFRDLDGQRLDARVIGRTGQDEESTLLSDPAALLDEQDTLSGEPSWFNSTYFDEIYHARTAFEHAHHMKPYETTHPPLGKVLMSWSVLLFGMTPFGWRFAGAVAGILMVPLMYLFAKQLTKRTLAALLGSLMMALDCMRLTQTRIATIDSFPVLFIMAAFWFMLRFLQRDLQQGLKKPMLDLGFSGLAISLAIASKWIGLYAALGLAVLYFWGLARALRRSTNRPAMFKRCAWLCLFCVGAFVLLPAVVYLLSYVPYFSYRSVRDIKEFVKLVIQAQQNMFSYHSTPGLGMDHPFYSPWYEWPLISRPMYYASASYVPKGYSYAIFAFGNPAVWLVGLAGMILTALGWLLGHRYRKEGSADSWHLLRADGSMQTAFVLIGFLAQFLPWVLVPRGTYIYHYFASVPFLCLAAVLVFDSLLRRRPRLGRAAIGLYLLICLVFFVICYPYASGALVPTGWLDLAKKFLNVYYAT